MKENKVLEKEPQPEPEDISHYRLPDSLEPNALKALKDAYRSLELSKGSNPMIVGPDLSDDN
jgi:hypothetical protein